MLGRVQVNNLNLMQGPLKEVENFFLFTGRGAGTNEGQLLTINQDTDLDAVLGTAASNLKTQVHAARLNAGQNWNGAILPLAQGRTWQEGASFAAEQLYTEAIVVTDPVESVEHVENMQAKAEELMAKCMRPMFVAGAAKPRPDTQTWEDYQTELRALTSGVAADQVTLTVPLWGPELGTYMGRLANRAVTIADTPMRVLTGPLVGNWTTRPVDANGRALDMGVLYALDAARFSVPQWYSGYEGTYWGDGNVLDVEGGDFSVIENLRVVQKAMRRVYPLAVARIGDRSLNETPSSIAQAKTYFTRPLREMSKSRTILGHVFPGEIHPPQDGCIEIHWITKTKVDLYISARPYNCPKDITCNILLDLENYAVA